MISPTPLSALSEKATPGPISLNPHNRLMVRTSMDHPMCVFSDAYHRQTRGGEGADPEFMVALWNAYRAGQLVASETKDRIDIQRIFQEVAAKYHEYPMAERAVLEVHERLIDQLCLAVKEDKRG